MKKMPSRDITGKCRGECRDLVTKKKKKRQKQIASEPYSTPSPNSPEWTFKGNEPHPRGG